MNYFNLLEISQNKLLDPDILRECYHSKAAQFHPDHGGDQHKFQLITEAYNTLNSPHKRLKHLLDLEKLNFQSKGEISSSVMDLFIPIGNLTQQINSHLDAIKKSRSALNRALLSTKSIELQESVESWMSTLEKQQASILKKVSVHSLASSKMQVFIRDLAFLERWKAQLKENYAELFCQT